MEAEFGVDGAGGFAAVDKAELDQGFSGFWKNSVLTNFTLIDPGLRDLRHSNPVKHQLQKQRKNTSFDVLLPRLPYYPKLFVL